jgi:hypothetical protein
MDTAPRFSPGSRLRRSSIDAVKPGPNLGRPGRLCVRIGLAVEALDQLTRKRGALFIRQAKSLG